MLFQVLMAVSSGLPNCNGPVTSVQKQLAPSFPLLPIIFRSPLPFFFHPSLFSSSYFSLLFARSATSLCYKYIPSTHIANFNFHDLNVASFAALTQPNSDYSAQGSNTQFTEQFSQVWLIIIMDLLGAL